MLEKGGPGCNAEHHPGERDEKDRTRIQDNVARGDA